MPLFTSHARLAGLFLLLAAVATAVSVITRLNSSVEPPPGNPILFPNILDTVQYVVAGSARTLSGFALVAAAVSLRLALRRSQPVAAGIATTLLGFSGAATAVSGACMLVLAADIPQAVGGGPGPVVAPIMWEIPGWIEPVDAGRWITGTIGFTLAGLGLIALGPVQWRIGGLLKISSIVGVIIGVAMLLIWLDAATIMHRVSGMAFLVWLVVAGIWLAAGLLKSPEPSAVHEDDVPQNRSVPT
jgi:hypothetical protein